MSQLTCILSNLPIHQFPLGQTRSSPELGMHSLDQIIETVCTKMNNNTHRTNLCLSRPILMSTQNHALMDSSTEVTWLTLQWLSASTRQWITWWYSWIPTWSMMATSPSQSNSTSSSAASVTINILSIIILCLCVLLNSLWIVWLISSSIINLHVVGLCVTASSLRSGYHPKQ